MRDRRHGIYVVVGVFMVAAVPTQAQPLFTHASSIETTVITAKCVLVGKIVTLDAPLNRDNFGGYGIAFEADEILKEPPSALGLPRKLAVRVIAPPDTLADWQSRSTRLLMATGDGSATTTTVIELTAGKSEVLTSDFQLLRDPDNVLQAARQALRRTPIPGSRTRTFRLEVPSEAVAGTDWQRYYKTGGYLILEVPVDERLEKLAQDYIRSDRYRRREEGLRALQHFRSDANIARARTLLNDAGWFYLARAQDNQGVEVRSYGIRQQAYDTLKSWGVDVEKPMVREEIRVQ